MNDPKKIALAYCIDNIKVAEEIDNRISQHTPFRFEHVYCKKTTSEPSVAERLNDFGGPILLIISDNFLKSAQCMKKGLSFLQNKGSQVLPIVATGYAKKEESGKVVRIPTDFERVSDIIQYINYWQDQYLDLRRQKRQLEGLDEENFNAHLKVMREISSEAGEFLRLLRNMEYVHYEQFATDHFKTFFEFVNALPTWESFREVDEEQAVSPEPAPAEDEIDTSGIPGMDMLDKRAAETPEETNAAEQPEIKEEEEEEEQMTELAREEEIEEETEEEAEEEEEDISEVIETSRRYANAGEWNRSIAVLSNAVEEHPDHTYLRYRYALMLAQREERIPDAMAQLYQILEVEPDNPHVQFLMGELAELRGNFSKARQYYERVAEKHPEHPDIFYRLGVVIANHYSDENEKAAGYFKRAFEKDPDNVDAIYQYAMLVGESLDRPEEAMQYFQRVLQKQEDHPFANYDLALIYHRLGETEQAREYYLRAIHINPELQTEENDVAFNLKEEMTESSSQPELKQADMEWSVPPPEKGQETEETEKVKEEKEEAISAAGSPPQSTDNGTDKEAKTEQAAEPEMEAEEEQEPQLEAEAESDPIQDLKENIRRLEEMLSKRKVAAAKPEKEKPGSGKIVMITGATSGIGRACAKEFAENGYRLILTGRRQERLDHLKGIFEELYDSEIRTLCFDVRNVDEIKEVFQDKLDFEWRQIDILINNAGKAKGFDPIHRGRLEHWEEMIDTNIKGLLYLTRAVVPYMIKRRNGHIINLASTAGKEVYAKGNVYCATKFAVEALTKAIRLDLLKYNIRVSQVSPGHVENTEFAEVRFDGNEEKAKIYEDFVPLNARDVAGAIYFIASRPRHVNIQDILMTGTQQAGSKDVDRRGRELVNFFIDRIRPEQDPEELPAHELKSEETQEQED